jgi:hypothetical protein
LNSGGKYSVASNASLVCGGKNPRHVKSPATGYSNSIKK